MTRPRIMWMDPDEGRHSEKNEERPKTMAEAIDRAYATHVPHMIDQEKLAFLVSRKKRVHLVRGMFCFTIDGIRYRYTPDQIPVERMLETFDVLINPNNLSKAYVLDLAGNRVSDATDYQKAALNGVRMQTREAAIETKKLRNKVIKLTRDAARATRQIDGLALVSKPTTEPVNPQNGDPALETVFASVEEMEVPVTEIADEDYLAGYQEVLDRDTNINQ